MKKLLLMFLSAFSIISCVDIESADFEDEIYEPKELKVKSVFLKWIDDDYINMVSTKTDYYYGANGYVSEIESYEIQKEAEERTTKNFYYTGNLIDSIVTNYEYKLTTGPNTGSEDNYRTVDRYYHNQNGLVTDYEHYSRGHKYYSDKYVYDTNDVLVSSTRYNTPPLPQQPTTSSGNYIYDTNKNILPTNFKSVKYDDKNFIYKNVYSPSLSKVICISNNNFLFYIYNQYGRYHKFEYVYNKDLFPETKKVYEDEKLSYTETISYY